MALSAIAGPNGEAVPRDQHRGWRRDRAVRLEQHRASRPSDRARSCAPTGGFQHSRETRAQRVDLALRQRGGAAVRLAERRASWLSVSPAAACRCGSRLSSSAAILVGSNFGCGFGGSASSALAFGAASSASSSPLPSSGPRRSDRPSAPASSSSAWPRRASASARLLGGRRRRLGLGRVDLLLRRRPWRSDRRPASASPIFSTSGFGVSLPSARSSCPWSSRRTRLSEMMSTGSASVRLGLERPGGERDQPPQQQGCVHDRRYGQTGLHLRQLHGALLDLRDQRDPAEAGGGEPSHHPHHCTVIHGLVAAHIDALVDAAARLR